MGVLNEFQVKLGEVSLDVDALLLVILVLIDQHEVRVDLKAAIFSDDDTDCVQLASLWIFLGH